MAFRSSWLVGLVGFAAFAVGACASPDTSSPRDESGGTGTGAGTRGRVNDGPSHCSSNANADADLLYSNDFEDAQSYGTVYPAHAGVGQACNDASVEAAFPWQYAPRVVRFPDGKSGIRFPTSQETPGGYDYSMQSPYVTFRGRFLDETCVSIHSVVRMPDRYDVSEPPYYGDLRYLFRYYIEGSQGRELFSVRFVSNNEIGFYENDRLLPERLKLQAAPTAGAPHAVDVEGCFVAGGSIKVRFDDAASSSSITLGQQFEHGNVFFVTSPGNRILSDDDLGLFSALDLVEVRRL